MLFRPSFIALSKHQRPSSQAWVSRQFRDPYVKQRLSDPAAYRSRSAFKLLQIDEQWDNFLLKHDVKVVVDLGAAPGGWSQVVAGKLGWGDSDTTKVSTASQAHERGYGEKGEGISENWGTWSSKAIPTKRVDQAAVTYDPVNIENVNLGIGQPGSGTIIAVDLLRMQPIRGVHTIQADFLSPEAESLIHGLLSVKGNIEGKVDVILSDMAANSSGNQVHDIESSLEICNAVFEFAKRNLRSAEDIGRKRGGVLLIKHFTHPLLQRFREDKLMPNFNDVRYIKPDSSRAASKEGYYLCQGWKGLES